MLINLIMLVILIKLMLNILVITHIDSLINYSFPCKTRFDKVWLN